MSDLIRILYVDDSPFDRELVRDALEREHGGFELVTVASRSQFEATLVNDSFDLILSDFNILGFQGLQVIETVHAHNPTLPVVIVTGTGSEEIAVAALKTGASDYIIKTPDHIRRLPQAIYAALEKQRVQQALAAEKRLLRTMIDLLPDAIYVKDMESRYVLNNMAAARIVGAATPEETIGKSDFDYFPHELAAGYYANEQAVMRQGKSIIDKQEWMDNGGEYAGWLSTSKVPLRDTQGEIIGLVGIGHDITERMENQAHIETQLNRLAVLHAIDMAITSSHDLTHTLNVVLEQSITRLSVDAGCIRLIHPDSQALTYAAGRGFNTALAEGLSMRMGEGVIGHLVAEARPFGTEDLVNIQADPHLSALWAEEGIVDYHGIPIIAKERTIGLLELFHRSPCPNRSNWQDFLETLARQTAVAVTSATLLAELQAQAQFTQQIIDSAPEGIVVLDQAQRLVLANPTARAYLPELAQLDPGELIESLDGQPLSALLNLPDSNQRTEIRLESPRRILEVTSQSLTTDPYNGGQLLVLWNVTEERDRQRYQQAQEQLATVGQLAAGIAHDFNNIMGAIILHTQLLNRSPNLDQRQHKQLVTIMDQAKHASNLTRQILDFGRRSVMEKTTMDLRDHLEEMIQLLRRTLPENINITLTAAQGDYAMLADPTRIQQALMNLALNARDAMPAGGELTVDLARLSLDSSQPLPLPDMHPGEWVQLTLTDTGVGISADSFPHLFEPFFTTKEPSQGTGLGLAQVYGIVKQHGGSIIAKSEAGKGAAFVIYLPLIKARALPIEPPPSVVTALGNGETILLVEDNEAVRTSICLALEELGYCVLSAADGAEALAILHARRGEIDLMLTDLIMPQVGGLALAKKVRHLLPGVPILIMTGYPLGAEHGEGDDIEIQGWISKPFNIPDLADKIESTLALAAP